MGFFFLDLNVSILWQVRIYKDKIVATKTSDNIHKKDLEKGKVK